jgi:hypothetical protein
LRGVAVDGRGDGSADLKYSLGQAVGSESGQIGCLVEGYVGGAVHVTGTVRHVVEAVRRVGLPAQRPHQLPQRQQEFGHQLMAGAAAERQAGLHLGEQHGERRSDIE